MNKTLWLGTFPGLNESHLDHIVEKLYEFFEMAHPEK